MMFGGWKNERVVLSSDSPEGRVVEVRRGDPPSHVTRVEGYLRVVNEDLGFASDLGEAFQRAYLFVGGGVVRGLLTIEPLTPTHTHLQIGVRQMWVEEGMRRRGVCSRLVGGMRGSVNYPEQVPVNQIAFSQLTSDGYAFASSLSSSSPPAQYSPKI